MKITPSFTILSLLFVIILTFPSYSQITFEPSYDIVDTEGYRSGLASAIADVNGDGRDDLIRVTERNILQVNFGSGNTTELSLTEFDAAMPDSPWNITVGNLDNEGPNEIALGTVYKGGFVFTYNEKQQSLELLQTTATDFYSQGANFVDMNNDGHLDWFICDDESPNEIYLNDGSGQLIEADDYIDMSSKVKSDNSGNYASDWVDIDSDGDLDCYISKCRSAAREATDPRRINQLFINDGNNNFKDKADEFNVDFGSQTWATNFGDLDNDGDLDAIIINHTDGWNLLENIDNKEFVGKPELINNLQGFAVQCILRDFDNNGYLDILVTGRNHYMWYNFGNLNFELERKPFPYFIASNFSVGDMNHDGFIDAYVAHTAGYNDPGLTDDILYINQKNENNWAGFRLLGTESNLCGIGARIRAYTPSYGWQIRDVRSGESYGMMNSLNRIFGIGHEEKIEEIEVTWPSGQVDRYFDIKPGSYYTITEGVCIAKDEAIEISDNGLLCENQTLQLSTKQNAQNIWSTGDDSKSIEVVRSGIFALNSISEDGCVTKAPAVLIRQTDEITREDIIKVDQFASCFVTSLDIVSPLVKNYEWSTGERNTALVANDSNTYKANIEDHCGEEFEVSKEIVIIDPTPKNILGDTVGRGATAELFAEGNNLKWYASADDQEALYIGNKLSMEDVQEDRTFYVQGDDEYRFESEYVGETEWTGTNMYGNVDLNGGMFFDVREDLVLESIEVYTDSIGEREFQILDADNEVIYSKTIDLVVGKNILDFDISLPSGDNYFITTEVNKNFRTFGFFGPRLQRSNTETKYPYRNSNLMWITNSKFGPQFMHYFYNWKIRKADLQCVSERIPVNVMLDINSSTDDEDPGLYAIYPNPTNSSVNIEYSGRHQSFGVDLYNIKGQKVFTQHNIRDSQVNIDLSRFPSGLYTILFNSFDGYSNAKRLIKTD